MTMVTLVMPAAGFVGEDGGAREAVVPGGETRAAGPGWSRMVAEDASPSKHLTFPG